MYKPKLEHLKRDCFIAMLIPAALLGVLQLTAKNLPSYGWFALAVAGVSAFCWYLYQFFTRLEDMTWQQQLNNVIHKVTTPVIIADMKHNITYVNDNFNRLPISTMAIKFAYLPALFSAFEKAYDVEDCARRTQHYEDILNKLCARIKMQFSWNGNNLEWTMIPLLSPIGKRWGTLIECNLKTEKSSPLKSSELALPLPQMLEQLAVPFMFVDKNRLVRYANLSLRMLLIRHQHLIKELSPELNIHDPLGNTLSYFIKLAQQDFDFNSLKKQGSFKVSLGIDNFELSLQPLWAANNEMIGTLILWHEEINAIAVSNEDIQRVPSASLPAMEIFADAFAQSTH